MTVRLRGKRGKTAHRRSRNVTNMTAEVDVIRRGALSTA